jgi:hypothetical protein
MKQAIHYPGPSQDDYANVQALNTAFIKASFDLKGPQRGRLAAVPFLLFSIRERDPLWWDDALSDARQGDWMAVADIESPESRCLQLAALSFLWHLARRNPYAVRIISGASISWCERITDLPLVTLLDRVGERGDLMLSRLDSPNAPVGRLLGNATSSKRSVRRSSQFTALQSLLTRTDNDGYTQLPAAACSMAGPMRVLDKKL